MTVSRRDFLKIGVAGAVLGAAGGWALHKLARQPRHVYQPRPLKYQYYVQVRLPYQYSEEFKRILRAERDHAALVRREHAAVCDGDVWADNVVAMRRPFVPYKPNLIA